MTSPGIQIRPLVMTSGEEVQNQVFFDDVRVPNSNVLGDIDNGWTVAKYLLEFERGGGASSPALQVMAEEIATVAAEAPGPDGGVLLDDPAFSRRLADAQIRTEVLEILEYRVLAAVSEGNNPGSASSMLKVLATELSQTLTELAMEAAGPRGRAYQPHATRPGGPVSEFEPPPDGMSAASLGRRLRRCATSMTGPVQFMPAATRFNGTFSPRQHWGSNGLQPEQGTRTAARRTDEVSVHALGPGEEPIRGQDGARLAAGDLARFRRGARDPRATPSRGGGRDRWRPSRTHGRHRSPRPCLGGRTGRRRRVVAGGLLRRAGGEEATSLLEKIVAGTAIVALAATEPESAIAGRTLRPLRGATERAGFCTAANPWR